MASADGDDGGPRVEPDVPDAADDGPVPHVPVQMPPVPTSGAPVGTNAEPLPMISPTSGAPIIRAVARRPPTPLPALGGTDAPRDVPHSAKVTVDRRRQAAAQGRATPPGQAQVPLGPQDPTMSGPARGPVAPAGAQGRATIPANPLDAAPNPAGRIPRPRVPGDAPPPSAEVSDSSQRAGSPRPGPMPSPGDDGWTSFGPPPPKPGLWRLPPTESAPAQQPTAFCRTDALNAPVSRRMRHSDPDENPAEAAEFGPDENDEPPRHARPAPATLAAPARPGGALLAVTSLLPRVVEATDPEGRALPPVLDADSWDDEPPEPMLTDEYLGRQRPARLPLRIWLVVALVLLGLGAAVVVPQLLSPAKNKETANGPVLGTGSDAPPATSGGELIQPASALGATSATTTTRPGAPAGTTPATSAPLAPTTAPKPPPPPFSLTLSAIDTHSYQSWQRQDGVCGGSVVLVGAWDAPRPVGAPPGTLTFSNITVPATGAYNMVITYAITIGGNRNATITLNGAGVNSGGSFAPACTGSRTIPLNFTKTSGNTIVFSNATSTAPSIMRIVISKP